MKDYSPQSIQQTARQVGGGDEISTVIIGRVRGFLPTFINIGLIVYG
jgi:hypothetical protein